MFWHVLVPPSLFWPNNILLCGYTTFWLPTHEVMDMPCIILEIVSIFFFKSIKSKVKMTVGSM